MSAPAPEIVQAAGEGNFEKVKRLLNAGADVNDSGTLGYSALHMAVSNNDFRMAEFLIMHGAEANIAPKDTGKTPLMIAAQNGNIEIVTLLLDSRAKIDSQNSSGRTALLYAVVAKNLKIAELLIMRGADVNLAENKWKGVNISEDGLGRTPLIAAAGYGDANFITLLLNNHADVNCKDNSGNTALRMAVFHTMRASRSALNTSEYLKIIDALLERGADVNIKTNDNELPMKMASKCSTKDRKKIEELFNKPRKFTKDRP